MPWRVRHALAPKRAPALLALALLAAGFAAGPLGPAGPALAQGAGTAQEGGGSGAGGAATFAFGSMVRFGDPDVGPPVLHRQAGALCFLDVDADGRYRPPEPVLASFRGCPRDAAPENGSAGPPDLLLSGSEAGRAFENRSALPGAVVRPLAAPMAFADLDGDGVWSAADNAYLLLTAGDARVEAGDLRLSLARDDAGASPSPWTNLTAGAFVAAGDADAGLPAGNLTPAREGDALRLLVWDLDADGAFDAGEPVYADLDGDGTVGIRDVRLSASAPPGPPGSGGPFGSRPVPGDLDLKPVLRDPPSSARVCFADLNEDGALSPGEPTYFRPAGCLDAQSDPAGVGLAVGDHRLSGPAAGTKVREGDSDVGAPVHVPPSQSNMRFYDADRDGVWGPGDVVYLHAAPGRQTVSEGDLRLTSFGSLPAGSFVGPGQSDLKFLTVRTAGFDPWPGRTWRYWDLDGDGAFGGDDGLYIDLAGDRQVGVGDVRLTSYAGLPAGRTVRFGDADAVATLRSPRDGASLCTTASQGSAGAQGESDAPVLFVGRPCTTVPAGAVVLNGPEAGKQVTRTAPLHNASLVPLPGINNVRYFDADGSRGWSDADTLYLHLAPGRSAVTAGDVRLTAYGSHLPGTRVGSGAEDLGLPTTSFPAAANLRERWQVWDVNGNGRLDLGEPLYIDADSSGTVSPLDVRMLATRAGSAANLSQAAQVAELQRTIDALEDLLGDHEVAVAGLEAELERRNATLREVRGNLSALQEENDALRGEVAGLRADLDAAREEARRDTPGAGGPAALAVLAGAAGVAACAAGAWPRRAQRARCQARPPPRRGR